MTLAYEHHTHGHSNVEAASDYELSARVQAEFHEMPGLILTLPQAARLFSIEPARCRRILEALVHAGYLATDGRAFTSPRSGRRSA